jgi:hypothetical protein
VKCSFPSTIGLRNVHLSLEQQLSHSFIRCRASTMQRGPPVNMSDIPTACKTKRSHGSHPNWFRALASAPARNNSVAAPN